MSTEIALRLVRVLNDNKCLADQVLSQPTSLREGAWRALGFECSASDVQALQQSMLSNACHETNLPRSWQCKGPCHTKCSDLHLSVN